MTDERTYRVWMHANNAIVCVADFATRDLADEYARYSNSRNPWWFEVRESQPVEVEVSFG